MKEHKLLAGDLVCVRSPDEIQSTLDGDGTLDGVPFMPEMLDWCGKSFRVQRRVVKTCVDGFPHARHFPANDVVILDGPRCDGHGHDGCKRGCRIFWKEAWLQTVDAAAARTQGSQTGFEQLRASLKVKSDEHHYFCQSTELLRSTEAFPSNVKLWKVRIPLREIRNGDRSVSEIARLFVVWCWQKLRRAAGADRWLRGPHVRTPGAPLHLKPGDLVRVKTHAQIVATLDQKSRNRGMSLCDEMMRSCGGAAEVRHRVDRLIDERTGTMREIADTVTLQNEKNGRECLCEGQLGDCPRGELMFWREIWLAREEGRGKPS